jgi:hypothetical protein
MRGRPCPKPKAIASARPEHSSPFFGKMCVLGRREIVRPDPKHRLAALGSLDLIKSEDTSVLQQRIARRRRTDGLSNLHDPSALIF